MNKQQRGQGEVEGFPRLLGERLCLDFVNSVETPLGLHPEDSLGSYADVARWAHHVGSITASSLEHLLREGQERPADAKDIFERAIGFRASLSRVFREVAQGQQPASPDLEQLGEEYRRALMHAQLVVGGAERGWQWPDTTTRLDQPLWAVAQSAIAVLTTDDLSRIRECPGAHDCGWLFYDTSRNGSRRWCSMEGCGSRVKMRQHYARQRADRVESNAIGRPLQSDHRRPRRSQLN